MKAKALEIRDKGTFIAALAVDMNPENDEQRYLLRHCGYPCNGEPNVIVTHLAGQGQATNDPYAWNGRTWPVAHKWIIEHWNELKDGDVVDVEWILGETSEQKKSVRQDDERERREWEDSLTKREALEWRRASDANVD